jgi:molecular chaperone GrpE
MRKTEVKDPQITELTADLQRQRADFENYRKNVEADKARLAAATTAATVAKLLPVLDDLDLALTHAPADLPESPWITGVLGLPKKLDTSLAALGLTRITATPGTTFDPNLHEALAGEGEKITAELRAGYTLNGAVIRPSLVQVG